MATRFLVAVLTEKNGGLNLNGLPKNQDKVLSVIGKLFARWD